MNNKIPCNTHELKILPKWFEDVQTNKKNFEIRKNDRNFEVGDYLILKEWHRGKFTDRYVIRQIEYIYKGDGTYGLTEDYCVLGLKVPQAENLLDMVSELPSVTSVYKKECQVDKDELIKALRYDRDQYTKGYIDCKSNMLEKVKHAREDVQKYINMCDEDSVAGINMKSGLAFALEILDKLAESEDKE